MSERASEQVSAAEYANEMSGAEQGNESVKAVNERAHKRVSERVA